MNTIDYLKKSPIYAMSLGSKELFHSNFWEWLIKRYRCFAKVFFPDANFEGKELSFKREYKHMDLTLHTADSIYVIENKFKSLPDKEQLERYTNDIPEKKFRGGCLVHFLTPDFEMPTKWEKKSYSEILKEMKDITNRATNIEPFDKEVILSYCQVFEKLVELLQAEVEKDKSFGFCSPKELVELRGHDIYSKLKVAACKQKIEQGFQEEKPDGFDISFKSGYSQDANLTIKYLLMLDENDTAMDENRDKVAIGIQIQGNVLRLFAEMQKNGYPVVEKAETLFDELAEKGWFDTKYSYDKTQKEKNSITFLGKALYTNMRPQDETRKSDPNKKFNAYKSKDEKSGIFLYQHCLCSNFKDDEEGIKFVMAALSYIKENQLHKKLLALYHQI